MVLHKMIISLMSSNVTGDLLTLFLICEPGVRQNLYVDFVFNLNIVLLIKIQFQSNIFCFLFCKQNFGV